MEKFLVMLKDNYLIFTIITVILILALIGYVVENTIGKDVTIKSKKKKEPAKIEEETIDSI